MTSHYSQVHDVVSCPLIVTAEEREMVWGKKGLLCFGYQVGIGMFCSTYRRLFVVRLWSMI